MYNSNLFYLGILCKNNHEYENTGMSLRYIKSNGCVLCRKERSRKQYNVDKEKYIQLSKEKRIKMIQENPNFDRERALKHKFGITLEEYQTMYNRQGGLCAICGLPETSTYKGKTRNLAVDHDHVTGEVRSLLCVNCNTALGSTQENVNILQKLINYILKGE